jgi:hypothetical protein
MSAKIQPWLAALAILLSSVAWIGSGATPLAAAESQDWNGTPEQKVWGLMQVWGAVKHNFAFFDHVPDLDWDATVQAAIPGVLAADSKDDYYKLLNEIVSQLHDGHTFVVAPALRDGTEDSPPVEFQVIEDRIILVRAGDTDEIRSQNVRPGLELVAVGENVPARQYLHENALRYYSGSTKQGGEAFGMFLFLRGPKDSAVKLTLKDVAGATGTVTLTRNSATRDGSTFQFRIRDFSRLVESRAMGGGIAYLRLATFDDEGVPAAFDTALDRLDPARLKGMILDLRYNMGGDDGIAWPVLSRLIDRPVMGFTWKTREYLPAFASWGKAEAWYQGDTVSVGPSTRSRYTGPLVVLTDPNTMSTSEDFLVPLDYAGRALLVGEATAGTTGNPINVRLPGGAILRVCSLRCTYPDGREFVGRGVEPDIVVHPTVAGIRANRDEVLEKAIEVLRDWDGHKGLAAYSTAK